MVNNIVQVIKSDHLKELMNKHINDLIVVMYSSKKCGPCQTIKPTFIKLSKDNLDCFFIYVDMGNFTGELSEYTSSIEGTPKFSFYYNRSEIAYIYGAKEEVLTDTLNKIKNRINEKIREITTQNEKMKTDAPDKNEEYTLGKKVDLLKKLYELSKNGIELSNSYDLNSDYDEMLIEYQFQMNKLRRNKIGQPTEDHQTQNINNLSDNVNSNLDKNLDENQDEKQQRIKKIQELNQLNQMMQLQKMQKIKQLEQIQLMKQKNETSKH